MAYRPNVPFNVPMKFFKPMYVTSNGVRKKLYPDYDEDQNPTFFCSFRTFGGTKIQANDIYAVQDTAVIETWYTPKIQADGKVKDLLTGIEYEILGTPENIERRNQFLKFEVRRLGGGNENGI